MPSLENREWGLKYFCGDNSHHSYQPSLPMCTYCYHVGRLWAGVNQRTYTSGHMTQSTFYIESFYL